MSEYELRFDTGQVIILRARSRGEAIGKFCAESGTPWSLVAAHCRVKNLGRVNHGEKKTCEFCHEDSEGGYKMHGAFYITNPFHAGEYYLNTHHCKSSKINFCPLCGRRLEGTNADDS